MNRLFTKDEINIISVESIRAQINPFDKTIRNNQNDNKTKTMSLHFKQINKTTM